MKSVTKWTASACLATGIVLAPTAALASSGDNAEHEHTVNTHQVSDSELIVANGSQGDIVTTIQKSLNAQGISTMVDGIYGPQTEENIMEFQSQEDLATDGIVGINTFPELTGYVEYPNQLFTENSYSLYVAQIQETLNDQGIDTHIDGIYGPQTKNNVMEFQNSRESLMTDGIVGPATWESLFEEQNISDEPSNDSQASSTEPPFLIMEGAPENMVSLVQQELNQVGIETTVDGIYGPETKANVKAFQREKEALMVDGIVGPNTWNSFNHHQ